MRNGPAGVIKVCNGCHAPFEVPAFATLCVCAACGRLPDDRVPPQPIETRESRSPDRSVVLAPCSWANRRRPTMLPRLVGWAPRGCPLRRASVERQPLECGSGEEPSAVLLQLRKVGSWESFGADERRNFTRAVWTCASPAQIFFTYDEEECHYLHEGSARVAIVAQGTHPTAASYIEVNAGDCFVTPAGARVCWDIITPIKKQTSCREPFRMVSQGWILAPPLSSMSNLVSTHERSLPTRTLRRSMSAMDLIDSLQEGISQANILRKRQA